MRQAIITFSLAGWFVLFAATIDLFDTLVMFMLFGILPGQEQPVSASQMLTVYTGATIAVILYAARPLLGAALKALQTSHAAQKSH